MRPIHFKGVIALLLITTVLVDCKKHEDPKPVPTITSFSPASGLAGATITLTGTNFSTTASSNEVKFNGTTAAVTSASASQLVLTVPTGATTGKITVAVNGSTATSANDFTVVLPPTVVSFTPVSAAETAIITITGTNFSTTAASNAVTFNTTAATVTAATATQLTTTVPAGATTGKISVTVNGVTVSSANDFTVLPTPAITAFTPEFHDVSEALPTVTITGTNFSTTKANNTVKFNGTIADVSAATDTQLTVSLPAAATSGKITVTVSNVTGASANDFLIGCPDATVQNVVLSGLNDNGSAFYVAATYDVKNVGTIPLDVNNMYAQTYVGTDASSQTGDLQATGGFARYGCCGTTYPLIAPGQTLRLTSSTLNGFNLSSYNYVIIEVLPELNGPAECSATNNEASINIR